MCAYCVFDTGAFPSCLSDIRTLCLMCNKMPIKHSILCSNRYLICQHVILFTLYKMVNAGSSVGEVKVFCIFTLSPEEAGVHCDSSLITTQPQARIKYRLNCYIPRRHLYKVSGRSVCCQRTTWSPPAMKAGSLEVH